jgi:UDP-N-acetylglucosamine:LPS N-acetylglucosamine transferase
MQRTIAILVNTAWNAYNFRKGLIRHFLDAGFKVVIIAPEDHYVSELERWGAGFVDIQLESSGTNPLSDYRYWQDLKYRLRQLRPDIILSYTIKPNIYGSLAAGALKIPIIANESGLGTTYLWKGWVQKAAIALYNRAFKKTSYVFFQNIDDRRLFLEYVKIP